MLYFAVAQGGGRSENGESDKDSLFIPDEEIIRTKKVGPPKRKRSRKKVAHPPPVKRQKTAFIGCIVPKLADCLENKLQFAPETSVVVPLVSPTKRTRTATVPVAASATTPSSRVRGY